MVGALPGVGADYFRERGIKVCVFQSFAIGKPCEARRERRKRLAGRYESVLQKFIIAENFWKPYGNARPGTRVSVASSTKISGL